MIRPTKIEKPAIAAKMQITKIVLFTSVSDGSFFIVCCLKVGERGWWSASKRGASFHSDGCIQSDRLGFRHAIKLFRDSLPCVSGDLYPVQRPTLPSQLGALSGGGSKGDVVFSQFLVCGRAWRHLLRFVPRL